MDLDVLFLGTAGSSPSPRRGLPATLVRRGGDRLLVDCGEGTQRQLMRSVGLIELEDVFITHFHADHVLGLPGILKTFALRQRERPLTIHGPGTRVRVPSTAISALGSARGGWRGRRPLHELLAPSTGRHPFELRLVELEPNDQLDRDGYRIAAFATEHVARGIGFAIVENPRPGEFDPVRARELGVTPGPDFGRLQRGEIVNGVRPDQVMGEARRGRKLVLTGDTAPCEMTRLVAWEADLLVHEATFAGEEGERAAETAHTTARQAGELGAAANVVMLALTHISPRYAGGELREEAQAAFGGDAGQVIVPRDFDRVEIPFPERGEPVHIRSTDRPAEPLAPEPAP